jgi:hypothetical protein
LLAFLKEQSEDHGGRHRVRPSESWPSEINDADHDNDLAPEEIEFVAQQMWPDGFEHGYRAILGSPIYVARTGQANNSRDGPAVRRHPPGPLEAAVPPTPSTPGPRMARGQASVPSTGTFA